VKKGPGYDCSPIRGAPETGLLKLGVAEVTESGRSQEGKHIWVARYRLKKKEIME